jgi:hypothetical protein
MQLTSSASRTTSEAIRASKLSPVAAPIAVSVRGDQRAASDGWFRLFVPWRLVVREDALVMWCDHRGRICHLADVLVVLGA